VCAQTPKSEVGRPTLPFDHPTVQSRVQPNEFGLIATGVQRAVTSDRTPPASHADSNRTPGLINYDIRTHRLPVSRAEATIRVLNEQRASIGADPNDLPGDLHAACTDRHPSGAVRHTRLRLLAGGALGCKRHTNPGGNEDNQGQPGQQKSALTSKRGPKLHVTKDTPALAPSPNRKFASGCLWAFAQQRRWLGDEFRRGRRRGTSRRPWAFDLPVSGSSRVFRNRTRPLAAAGLPHTDCDGGEAHAHFAAGSRSPCRGLDRALSSTLLLSAWSSTDDLRCEACEAGAWANGLHPAESRSVLGGVLSGPARWVAEEFSCPPRTQAPQECHRNRRLPAMAVGRRLSLAHEPDSELSVTKVRRTLPPWWLRCGASATGGVRSCRSVKGSAA
jgi:hypothetical protein